jgi:hypothetical protein
MVTESRISSKHLVQRLTTRHASPPLQCSDFKVLWNDLQISTITLALLKITAPDLKRLTPLAIFHAIQMQVKDSYLFSSLHVTHTLQLKRYKIFTLFVPTERCITALPLYHACTHPPQNCFLRLMPFLCFAL